MAAPHDVTCPQCRQPGSVYVRTTNQGNYIERLNVCRNCGCSWIEASPKPRKGKRT